MSNGKYVILACDGGGIRGLISKPKVAVSRVVG